MIDREIDETQLGTPLGASGLRGCEFQFSDLVPLNFRSFLSMPVPHNPPHNVLNALQMGSVDRKFSDQSILQAIQLLRETDTTNITELKSLPPTVDLQPTPLQTQFTSCNAEAFNWGQKGQNPSAIRPLPSVPGATMHQPDLPASSLHTAELDLEKARKTKVPILALPSHAAADSLPENSKEHADEFAESIHAFLEDFGNYGGSAAAAEDIGSRRKRKFQESDPTLLLEDAKALRNLANDLKVLEQATLRACSFKCVLQHVPLGIIVKLQHVLGVCILAGKGRAVDATCKKDSLNVLKAEVALNASIIALRIMTSQGAPPQVHMEDTIQAITEGTRFHLQHTVFPMVDARFSIHAGPLAQENDVEPLEHPSSIVSMKQKKEPPRKTVNIVTAFIEQLQDVLHLLCDLLPAVKLQSASLVPLARTCIVSLTINNIPLLQAKASALLATMFLTQPDLRRTVLDQLFMSAIPHLSHGKNPPREYMAAELNGRPVHVQMITATLLLMVQNCIRLPQLETPVNLLPACSNHAVWAADHFWSTSLDRLPAARIQNADTSQDFRILLDNIVQDLLAVLFAPEWPAASFLLLRLIWAINSPKGLRHADNSVKQFIVDLLGRILSALRAAEILLPGDKIWLQDNIYLEGSTEDGLHTLLLSYLSDSKRHSQPVAVSARQFWVVRLFVEEAGDIIRAKADDLKVSDCLQSYCHKVEYLDEQATAVSVLNAADAWRVMRLALQGSLSRASALVLQWLLETLDPKQQGPTIRAKAVKAIGDVVSVDDSVLELPIVQEAISKTLEDDSISVREASLALIGRHIAGNIDLTLQFFNIIMLASEDSGPSVRKCAIKILYDCCINAPDFPHATDACRAVMMRSGDAEESIQNLVAKVFHGLWFASQSQMDVRAVERSAIERAQQLAAVALGIYQAGGRSIRLPLDVSHPLVVVIQSALTWASSGDLEKEWQAGRDVSAALLTQVLRAEEGGASSAEGFSALLALHAFSRADVALCIPKSDPSGFARSLAPYLKADGGLPNASGDEHQRSAERLLCVLAILDDILGCIAHVGSALDIEKMTNDLIHLINHHRYTQVMAAACKCLCTLAAGDSVAAGRLASTVAIYWGWLNKPEEHHPPHVPRFLYIVGQLCRHGADVLEKLDMASLTVPAFSFISCMDIFIKYHHFNGPPSIESKVQKCALEAVGLLAVGRPKMLVAKNSKAKKVIGAALRKDAPAQFKLAALDSLTALLEADAEDLRARQRQALASPNAKASKHSAQKRKMKKDEPTVPAQIGVGDDVSQSGAVIQQHWNAVLGLASDVSVDGSPVPGSNIRRRVMDLVEVVTRDGLVGPWTAVPSLVMLATDPVEDIRQQALRILSMLGEKHPRYIDADKLMSGMDLVYKFHSALSKVSPIHRLLSPAPISALSGLADIYLKLISPSRQLKSEFLKVFIRQFKQAPSADAASRQSLNTMQLSFYASMVASLPLKKGDEVCTLLHEASSILGSQADNLLDDMKHALETSEALTPELQNLSQLSSAFCILAILIDYFQAAYAVNPERVAGFASTSERRKQEEKVALVRDDAVVLQSSKLEISVAKNLQQCISQFKVFEALTLRTKILMPSDVTIAGTAEVNGAHQGTAARRKSQKTQRTKTPVATRRHGGRVVKRKRAAKDSSCSAGESDDD